MAVLLRPPFQHVMREAYRVLRAANITRRKAEHLGDRNCSQFVIATPAFDGAKSGNATVLAGYDARDTAFMFERTTD